MKRFLNQSLELWKKSKGRKPLLIRGSRQVGKTWVVREHAKSYANFLEINLESHPEYIPIFKENFGKPDRLIRQISALSGHKIIPGETLLFIDEVQVSKEALLSLRYFYEKFSAQHIIAAGSLLEFTFQELSFPVGRIEYLYLYPLSFKEFLLAQGLEDLIEESEQAFLEKKALSAPLHEKMLQELRAYFLIGGLPEAVSAYVESLDFEIVQKIQQTLLIGYREDFHKYASKAQIPHVNVLFQAIPRLIGKKFKYSEVDDSLRSRELSASLELLEQAGLAYKIMHSSCDALPLASQSNPKKFKVFSLDIGLCQRLLSVPLAQAFALKQDWSSHKGALAEQFVAQELVSYGFEQARPELHCWYREERSSHSEMDFVVPLMTQKGTKIIPIEVKSERAHSLRSLGIFLDAKSKNSPFGVVLSSQGFSEKEKVKYLPLYSVWMLQHLQRNSDIQSAV